MRIFNRKTLCIAAVLAFVLPTAPAWAELTVEASDAPGIEIDEVFPDNHVFEVPAGAKVELIRKPGVINPEGDTHRIEGRTNGYTGTLDDYVRRECWRLDADCGPVNEHRGGTKGLVPHKGGVEGVAPKE